MGWGRRTLACALAALVLLPSIGRAEDPIYVHWVGALPALTPGFDPDSDNDCEAGKESCVHGAVREMYRRWEPLDDSCDHDAVFALAYLRTTEEYHRFWHEDRFSDSAWMNHYDVTFARY